MSYTPPSIAERIAQLRVEAGLTKSELARRIGTSDVTVGYWESGEIKSVRHTHLINLALTFGITVSELIEDPLLPDYRERVLKEAQDREASGDR